MQKKAEIKITFFWLFGIFFFITSCAQLQSMSRVYRLAHRSKYVKHDFLKTIQKRNKRFLKHKKPYAIKQKELLESMVTLLQQNAMEIDSDDFEVVTGDLMVVPGGLKHFYTSPMLEDREKSPAIHEEKIAENLPTTDMTLATLYDLEGNPLTIQPDDLVATVLIQSKECEQWGRYLHPLLGEFPLYLPVSLLQNKHEGDVVSFVFQKIGTEQRFKIELTCRQQAGLYYPAENFEDTMAESFRYLKKTLSFLKQSKKKQKNKIEAEEEKQNYVLNTADKKRRDGCCIS